MTHDRNRKHLPPAKSAREYEAEIERLEERLSFALDMLVDNDGLGRSREEMDEEIDEHIAEAKKL